MRFDDFLDIRLAYSAVPHRVGIDDNIGPVLALIEAARLIRADSAFQSTLSQLLLEEFLQPRFGERIAASPWMSGRTVVSADENVLLEWWHQAVARALISFAPLRYLT
jgi:hypothetical protein